MSKAGTGGSKKTNFKDFSFSSVNEDTFKNEKFPELEDPAYPNQLIQQLEAQAKEKDKEQKKNHASTPDALKRRGHYTSTEAPPTCTSMEAADAITSGPSTTSSADATTPRRR